jgi:predicted dehydrogenase
VPALRWLVIGAGSIGRRHLRNLLALGARPSALRRGALPLDDELADVPVTDRLPSAAGGAPGVAVICTPSALHIRDALAAVREGWHVLIEKPLGSSLDGMAELEAEVGRRHAVAMVASCLRFHPVVQAVAELLRTGAVGDVLHVDVWCGQDLREWRPGRDVRDGYSADPALGGGVLLDLIHEIDYLHWWLGAGTVEQAHLVRRGPLALDVEESADLVLTFGGGTVGSCHLDYWARPAVRGGRLLGAGGSLRWDLLAPSLEVWTDAAPAWAAVPMPPRWEPNELYLDELRHLADCVLAGAPTLSPLADGARAVATVLAARAAAEA